MPPVVATSQQLAGATTVCPTAGLDTDCGTIITITDAGSTVSFTGQKPYEGADDTLVGVVNKSRLPVRKLLLSSSGPIFGFDGDGIDTFGVAGNAHDGTGYGGPNAFFTNINAAQSSGEVDFVTPIAARTGTSFFSLETALNGAVSCQDLINNALGGPTTQGARITATFTPNSGFSLHDAAVFCGFTDFDWQQRVTSLPLPNPFFQKGNPKSLKAPPPFLDPPPGGYSYQTFANHTYPFYYDANNMTGHGLDLATNQNGNTLSFFDAPADPCLPGGTGAPCGGKTAKAGSILAFTTHLAGVNSDGSATDLGIGFNWNSTFNGTSGGAAALNNPMPVDPGSGTGGVTVTSVTRLTNYQFNGLTVGTGGSPTTTISGSHPGAVIVTGPTAVTNAQVGGAIVVQPGASLDLEHSTVGGSLDAANSPGAIRICDSTITGQVTILNASTPVFLGVFGDPSCGPNTFLSGVNIQ